MVPLWVREHAEEVIGFLQELVRCERPSSPPALTGSNAQDRVEAEAEGLGLETRRLVPDLGTLAEHPGYRETGHDYGERPVVIGRAPGAGGGRSLILNGHADIVGAGDPERWNSPPHAGVRVGGRIVGRGTADAKGPLTALLFGLACARDVSGGLRGDVTFMSVADEELGGMCTLAVLEAGYTADAAVVGEPTGLAIAPASRGAASFRLDVSGREAHSGAAFKGVNAILKTMKYVEAMEQLQRDLDRERRHPLYAGLPVAHCFNVGTISGGEWAGVVPASCSVEVVAGGIAGETVSDLERWVEERVEAVTAADDWLREHPPTLTWTSLRFDPGGIPAEHPLVEAALAAGQNALGRPPALEPLLGGSDLRFFTNYFGIPAVHFGPGEMSAGHSYDESIGVDALLKGTEIAAHLVLEWCG